MATFAALRKRGITPEAIKKLIVDVGPKPADVTLSWENLYSYNRKLLDPQTDRYFFVPDPVELRVKNLPKIFHAALPLHPEKPEKGQRKYTITPKGEGETASFWMTKKDAESAEVGVVIRLMELFNVKIDSKTADRLEASFASESYEDAREAKAKLIHWIAADEAFPCQVVMPDTQRQQGLCGECLQKVKAERCDTIRKVRLRQNRRGCSQIKGVLRPQIATRRKNNDA